MNPKLTDTQNLQVSINESIVEFYETFLPSIYISASLYYHSYKEKLVSSPPILYAQTKKL